MQHEPQIRIVPLRLESPPTHELMVQEECLGLISPLFPDALFCGNKALAIGQSKVSPGEWQMPTYIGIVHQTDNNVRADLGEVPEHYLSVIKGHHRHRVKPKKD